ncbi:MAG: UDP-N-acetylglucosamine--N-acetylmuramyl-(pentapeptide) pyrophosphoryl-undecaprenol N-acetylglucosamine transferase, partial [Lentisphaeria bacterium]|nr:UDP-N-acetylglucosamine--N-acetylmuramyl-(pentapeptide) pyrophosphoryl-undecaprenol N-acetylglucosamine transferase [Lentisphaeria bacterium]
PGCDRMELLYSAVDFVLSRSGGSTLAELALFGKPAILIPYPYAMENHQYDNACVFVDAGAAILLEQTACSPERIADLIRDYLEHPGDWLKRAARALSLAKPDASDGMLDRIFQHPEA